MSITAVETVLTCPLGSKCEEIKDNKIHRCAWFTQLAGKNPSTGETLDERGCAITWLPILLVENSMQQRSTSAAVESFRNEVIAANEQAKSWAFLPQTTQDILE